MPRGKHTPADEAQQLAAGFADHAAATLRLADALAGVTAALEATAHALTAAVTRQHDRSTELAHLTELVQRHESDLRTLLADANDRRDDLLAEQSRRAQDVATALHQFFLRARRIGRASGGPFSGRTQPDPEQALFAARVLWALLSPTGAVDDQVTRPAVRRPAEEAEASAELAAEAAQLLATARAADADFVWHTPLPPDRWSGCPHDGAVAFAVRPGVVSRGTTFLPALVYTITPPAPPVRGSGVGSVDGSVDNDSRPR
ncbi:hypothetical protein ABZ953_03565 [Streptomyces sp. NPDC046465]|uniref:hypothetical protein n=1 Tax=Streptomyces sp. NPDC046465 TaxID=3155810 RepID=UPI0033FE931D